MLIHLLGRALSSAPSLVSAVVVFGLLVPPTMLIGVTLPMIATNEIRVRRSVGDGVGRGYFSVLLGAGAASALAALVLCGSLGQSATVQGAAVLNLGAGLLAFAHSRAPKVIR
jgi:spermidine synthase